MSKVIQAIFALQMLLLSAQGDMQQTSCFRCAGSVSDLTSRPTKVIPLLIRSSRGSLPAVTSYVKELSSDQRSVTTLIIDLQVPETTDPLLGVEADAREIADWAKANGPFEAIGVRVSGAPTEIEAYATKRLSVLIQGLGLAKRIAAGPYRLERLAKLYETGVQSYFDELLIDSEFETITPWMIEKDPAKKLSLQFETTASNDFYDIAERFRSGAFRVYLENPSSAQRTEALASFNKEFAGDFSFEPAARIELLDAKGAKRSEPVLSFVRGTDLRRIVVPPGDPGAPNIVSLPGEDYINIRRVGAEATAVTDTGRKGGRFLVGYPASSTPFLLTVDRDTRIDQQITRESIDIVTATGITVEEIIRNHQAYRAFQDTVQPRYIARNETKLRFSIGEGGESVEATLAGDYFSSPSAAADWVWQDFLINGVRWKYGRIPELPLIQPEKVTQLPLDIHLTNDYRYVLSRETRLRGYDCYEVRFEPPTVVPDGLPLYRGTIWIEKKSWARIRISTIQLNLAGEILSNEERVDYLPFDLVSGRALTPEEAVQRSRKSMIWLAGSVSAQQVLSTAGRSTVVLRSTDFSNFRISPDNWDAQHQSASASSARMVRETDHGLRYLEKSPNGERVVKENFDSSRIFLLSGLHHDAGLEFPVVPLGGIDYFNFNTGKRGIQTNLFFAGVIVNATASLPSVAGTRTSLAADFFGLAVPFSNSMYRDGREVTEESVKALPLRLSVRGGHPIWNFGKIDLVFDISHLSYQRSETTTGSFVVPQDTFVVAPSVELRYDRWGYSVSGAYQYGVRTRWAPWGLASEYNSRQKRYSDFNLAIGKSIYLPKFQRIGLEVNYLDGTNLDRFSKYELGFFGSQRIRGVKSGSVRAERALLGHVSYGFVFSQQFRVEAFYDHGLITDASAGYHDEPFQGVGFGGQTIGPWGTILRTDVGRTIGRNAQDGFVANIVMLKLF